MQFKTAVLIGMGVVGFGIWSYAAFNDPTLQEDYLTFVKGIVIGVAGLALRDMGTSTSTSTPPSTLPTLPSTPVDSKQEEVKQ